MTWRSHLWRTSAKAPTEAIGSVRADLPGWSEDTSTEDMRIWRDVDGDVVSLTLSSKPISGLLHKDEAGVRRRSRQLAQDRGGGLIEAFKLDCGIRLIYKRLLMPAYVYTGMNIIHVRGVWVVWTVVAGEHGTTGVREAVVTAMLLEAGELKPEEYAQRWGQDPYDPAYRETYKSILRFMSDDERYDNQFPQHPLSKCRRMLVRLSDANAVSYDF